MDPQKIPKLRNSHGSAKKPKADKLLWYRKDPPQLLDFHGSAKNKKLIDFYGFAKIPKLIDSHGFAKNPRTVRLPWIRKKTKS